jgi:signal transduction histidine kinase
MGFDADTDATGDGASGFGLFSIRERLGFLGGTMHIHSAPGSGTSVALQVPLAHDAPQRQEQEAHLAAR